MKIAGVFFLAGGISSVFLGGVLASSGADLLTAETVVLGITMVSIGYWFIHCRAKDLDLRPMEKERRT